MFYLAAAAVRIHDPLNNLCKILIEDVRLSEFKLERQMQIINNANIGLNKLRHLIFLAIVSFIDCTDKY